MSLLRLWLLSIVFVLISHPVYSEESVVYSVTDESWPPYWIVNGKNVSGVFSDIMKELDHRLVYTLVPSEPIPVNRSKLIFTKGDLAIECCINIAWRETTDSGGETRWTEAVLNAEEVIVFPAGKSFPVFSGDDLKGRNIATILGYGYTWDDKFIRHDTSKNIYQLNMVAMGRTDAAIMDRFEFAYMLKHEPQVQAVADKLELGPVISPSALRMRIHSSRAYLLAPINRAIKGMKSDGTIAKIVKSYVNH